MRALVRWKWPGERTALWKREREREREKREERGKERELKRVEEGRDQDHEVADCFSARPN